MVIGTVSHVQCLDARGWSCFTTLGKTKADALATCLYEAVELNLPYKLPCPVLLICGTKDNTGSSKRYNKAWSKTEGYRLEWIDGAGHNSNTDRPEQINKLIEDFVSLATKVHNSDL